MTASQMAASQIVAFNCPNAISLATFGYLALTVRYLCDLQDVMEFHWLPNASHPTLT